MSQSNAIIYDFDGVIVNTEHVYALAFKEVYLRFGHKLKDFELYQMVGRSIPEIFKTVLKNKLVPISKPAIMKEINTVYFKLIDSNDISLPGAIASIKLMSQYFPLSIVTGSETESVNYILSKLKINKYFSKIITSDDYTYGKPNPEGLLLACKKMKMKAEKCVVFEDSNPGIIAANRAKMKSIAVLAGNTTNQDVSTADLIVDSLQIVDKSFINGIISGKLWI